MAIDVLPDIALRYQVPETKVRELFGLLRASGGRQCQFHCEELGGPVQWVPGRVTVSRGNDHDLRNRVEGLCSELAAVVQGSETSAPAALRRGAGAAPTGACAGMAAGESWWPAKFGQPADSGEQNGVRYAFFPELHRLLIQEGARLSVYDTGDRRLTGTARPQDSTSHLVFSTDEGPVELKQFKCVPLQAD